MFYRFFLFISALALFGLWVAALAVYTKTIAVQTAINIAIFITTMFCIWVIFIVIYTPDSYDVKSNTWRYRLYAFLNPAAFILKLASGDTLMYFLLARYLLILLNRSFFAVLVLSVQLCLWASSTEFLLVFCFISFHAGLGLLLFFLVWWFEAPRYSIYYFRNNAANRAALASLLALAGLDPAEQTSVLDMIIGHHGVVVVNGVYVYFFSHCDGIHYSKGPNAGKLRPGNPLPGVYVSPYDFDLKNRAEYLIPVRLRIESQAAQHLLGVICGNSFLNTVENRWLAELMVCNAKCGWHLICPTYTA